MAVTDPRPGFAAHTLAVRASFPEVVQALRDILGPRLVAYLGSVRETRAVHQWADDAREPGSGRLDHVAFRAVDLEATRHNLTAAGIPFREAVVPRDGTVQIFVHDPDGLTIELNFEGSVRS